MLLIAGQWREGRGVSMRRESPVDGAVTWAGSAADEADVADAVQAARAAFPDWAQQPLAARQDQVSAFAELLRQHSDEFAALIAGETGKPLWEAHTEVGAMIGKIAISIEAQGQRAGDRLSELADHRAHLSHRPHGVMAVYGPYNFPGHLPNGHIVPALLAGNSIVFKPSELAPATAARTAELWQQAGLPDGVLNLVQGAAPTGVALAAQELDGILFTGSARTGRALHAQLAGRPEVILALEMGGNNPLLVAPGADRAAAVSVILPSAFLSAGQRCTCARRLLVPAGEAGDALLEDVIDAATALRIDRPDAKPPPFMGPVVSAAAAQSLLAARDALVDSGAVELLPLRQLDAGAAWLGPGLVDVTPVRDLPDEEYFGPLLCVQRYQSFDDALLLAGQTRYGLAAGLIGGSEADYAALRRAVPAGIVNWNRPLTGASSRQPFGGSGWSGNHRPGAWYAADYCAFPVASLEAPALTELDPLPGMGP